MTHRLSVPARLLLLSGAVACLVAPWLDWVVGHCGWFCYTPVSASVLRPILHGPTGWDVAGKASAVLLVTGLLALLTAGVGRTYEAARRATGVVAAGGSVWSVAVVLRYGHSPVHTLTLGLGGLAGAAGAALVAVGLLLSARPAGRSRVAARRSPSRPGSRTAAQPG